MPTDWTLALDSTSAHASVALLNDGALHATRKLEGRNFGDQLFVTVETLLEEAGITLPEVARIGVADGPGSFTGVRIGLAAAKGWHEALGLAVTPISTLRAVVGLQPLPALGALDASRGEVYFGLYWPDRAIEGLEPLTEFRQRLEEWQAPAYTPDESLRKALPLLQLVSAELSPAVGWLSWSAGASGTSRNVMALDARYLRAPDAALPTAR